MNNGSLGNKLLIGLICAGVMSYFGIQATRYIADPLTTTACYTYRMEEIVPVTGYVVRDEQVLAGDYEGLLRLSRKEGERVSAGGEVAVVYADQASVDLQEEIAAVRSRVEQLEFAAQSELSAEVSLKLDNQIVNSMFALRRALAADRLSEAGEDMTNLRGLVMKRDYTYTGGADAAEQLTQLQEKLAALEKQASGGIQTIRAGESGIYSAVVDGYEAVLTPETLETLTPGELLSMQAEPVAENSLGKLILSDVWYYAVNLSERDAAQLGVGETVTLRFAKGSAEGYSVKLTALSEPENGRVAATFSSDRKVQELTLLRRQSAELVLNEITGIRVPKEALRVNEEGQTGLYCLLGRTARFKPAEVLYTDEDYVLVAAVSERERTRLRPGDEVIINAKDLHDGKIVT